jgi:MFS transporter, SP family, sugar:H+ symporter
MIYFSGTVFLKQLNIMDPFTATMIKRAMLVASCIFVILFVERVGRRRLCLIVGSMMAATLLIMGSIGSVKPRNTAENNTILAMTLLFPVGYMIGFGSTWATAPFSSIFPKLTSPSMQIVKSELPHTSLRDKSVMLHWNMANLCNFVVTFTLPYLVQPAAANLGPRVGFIYGSISVIIIILIFFFVPEMTGRSLEEIDEMVEAKVPAWRTRRKYHL